MTSIAKRNKRKTQAKIEHIKLKLKVLFDQPANPDLTKLVFVHQNDESCFLYRRKQLGYNGMFDSKIEDLVSAMRAIRTLSNKPIVVFLSDLERVGADSARFFVDSDQTAMVASLTASRFKSKSSLSSFLSPVAHMIVESGFTVCASFNYTTSFAVAGRL